MSAGVAWEEKKAKSNQESELAVVPELERDAEVVLAQPLHRVLQLVL